MLREIKLPLLLVSPETLFGDKKRNISMLDFLWFFQKILKISAELLMSICTDSDFL